MWILGIVDSVNSKNRRSRENRRSQIHKHLCKASNIRSAKTQQYAATTISWERICCAKATVKAFQNLRKLPNGGPQFYSVSENLFFLETTVFKKKVLSLFLKYYKICFNTFLKATSIVKKKKHIYICIFWNSYIYIYLNSYKYIYILIFWGGVIKYIFIKYIFIYLYIYIFLSGLEKRFFIFKYIYIYFLGGVEKNLKNYLQHRDWTESSAIDADKLHRCTEHEAPPHDAIFPSLDSWPGHE